ncbi:MFS sugar transporter [Steccherinum ochraceum]|uniref:MFS sugar transporter n=1 Tax=Steccherinum ochraceum TaxID=92696 RepID=A0A4R0RF30_9APHY|nr:MFS sugar transporter [Steccherinum ochraceum]
MSVADANSLKDQKDVDVEGGGKNTQFHVETQDVFDEAESGIDPVYQAKARILNDAFQELGMGKYQWWLFVVTGFGWFSDNLWPIVTSLILAPVVAEFGFQGPWLKLGQNVGLLVGAAFWGVACDVWGRQWAFNITLFITGVFAVAAGGSPGWIALCSLAAVWSIGVGGNLPVDSAVFLEFIPASHQYLLTVLSIWWAFGQLIGSLIAWPLIANFSCAGTEPSTCPRSENQGWRYFMYTMGGLMLLLFIIRFFVFHLYESPKYLMGRGRDEEAVEVVKKVAAYNGRETSLTLEMLQEAGRLAATEKDVANIDVDTSAKAAALRKLQKFDVGHVKPLFATRKLAYSTSLLIILWALIGLAFPLYNGFVTFFLQTRGADFGDGSVYTTYRNQVIISVIGVPGALLAGWLVELPYLGRKGTLAISTRVFLFAGTTARTSDALLGWNCGYTFTSNVMYGVLYAVSPELFPTKDRGTGNAIVATANRVFGIMAPIIALYADLSTPVPIYVSGALFLVSGFIALLLPFEPRGKASL